MSDTKLREALARLQRWYHEDEVWTKEVDGPWVLWDDVETLLNTTMEPPIRMCSVWGCTLRYDEQGHMADCPTLKFLKELQK
jgi:hypothetical protein